MPKQITLPTLICSNGDIYNVKRVFKMVKQFEAMSWIEQQSFLSVLMLSSERIKPPPNENWKKKYALHEIINPGE